MMPSAGPRSQCGFGSKSNTRGSPWRRTSWLSARRLPDRNARVRQVRQHQERPRPLVLDGVELHPQLLDLLRPRAVGLLNRRGVLALRSGARDLVARRVLLPLQALDLGNEPAPGRFERGELFERLVGIETAVAKPARTASMLSRTKVGSSMSVGSDPPSAPAVIASGAERQPPPQPHCIFAAGHPSATMRT